MYHSYIKNFEEWQEKAREFLYAEILPADITWYDTNAKQKEIWENLNDTNALFTVSYSPAILYFS
jgi:hypothetical protein